MISLFSGRKKTKPDGHYPFSCIWINGRPVLLEEILHEKVQGHTTFEKNTFDFIRAWLSEEEKFVMPTSGSTGKPKNIFLSRDQMIASSQHTARRIALQKFTTALVCIDTRYIGGKMMLVRSLINGLRIIAFDPVANPLVKIPIDKCVQFTAFVPYQIQSVLESKHPHLLNNFDKILIGGAPLGAAIREQLGRYQCACYETYGMTETASHIALRLVNTNMKQPYFETMPGIEIKTDDRGCMVITADYLPYPVTTNDIVEILDENKFLWHGRWDNVINTGGIKVAPEKIEKQLEGIFQRLNLYNRFFIAALPDERLGNKIVLIIEGVQFSSETLQEALNALKSTVAPYEFPKEVFYVPAFSLTESQKIDRIQTLPGAILLSSLK